MPFWSSLDGMNAVVNYAPKIFQGAGFEIKNALLNTSFIGFINFVFTFVAIVVIDKVGRKTLYLVGSLGMCVSLLCLAVTYFLHLEGILTMVFVLAFVAFFAACIGPVFWTLCRRDLSEPDTGKSRRTCVIGPVERLFPRGAALPALPGTGRRRICLPVLRRHGSGAVPHCEALSARNARKESGRDRNALE